MSGASNSGAALGSLLRQIIVWVVFAAVVVVLPHLFTSGSSISMMSQMGVFILFALSYNMLLGEAGMLSFGHAVYFGIGGFFTLHAIRAVNDGVFSWPLELMPLVGGAGGLLFGIIFGSVSTRRAGVTFAMITLGIGSLVESSANMFTDFFGGESGISANRVTEVTLLPFSYGPQIQVYYLIGAWTVFAALLMYLLTRTPLGRISNAVRDNPERAQFVGYNTTMARFVQFALSGFFAGIAGGLFAIMFEIMTASNVGLIQSGSVLLMTFIGGVGVFFGPIIGAVLITYMQTALSGFSEGWILYFGLLFVFMVMYAPMGIAGVIVAHFAPWRAGQLHRLIPVYALAVVPAMLALAGLVSVIEMGYHLSLAYDPSQPIDLFYMQVNVTRLLPWVVAVVVLAVGVALLKWVSGRIRERWNDINKTTERPEAAR
ncbi:branched-chain amino acid ABC transporter permease [Salinisphaera aquimarina]|uniref:Branched-chain amino acid ABC transporter permease n=1 Tax=Salinisphaera aquimarina TaxID=2094031 RepID=A0ABV7ETD0_9GAMM